ncbi:TrmH family RNA methyltransferase [Flavobacterium ardleyense]|uniref:TrmH family RNA methyltransferase n=1 Tax=Flavobacterium ardleyense TaxID=2038737 RepID=UPI00298D16A9|nr:RNA methyltransferase [Flavobacterium ardleyense]
MVTKNQIKHITALQQKKYRQSEGLFIAEGQKVINELLHSQFKLQHLYFTDAIFPTITQDQKTQISDDQLKKISALTTQNNCLAVFAMQQEQPINTTGLVVALDNLRDPGNMGTIIRLCDWFGITQLLCSHGTVDLYNPKVVQATMGSLTRVQVNYVDLPKFLEHQDIPVFGTFMDGENIYTQQLPQNAIIVLGNEANGISAEIENVVTQKLAIPRFGDLQATESLNVASATAIILSEFSRNKN